MPQHLMLVALKVFDLAYIHIPVSPVAQEPPQPQHLHSKSRHNANVRGGHRYLGGTQQLLDEVYYLSCRAVQ